MSTIPLIGEAAPAFEAVTTHRGYITVLFYPPSNGRNMLEILRVVVTLQTTDKWNVATPADWQPGADVIVPPAGSCGTAEERVQGKEAGVKCLAWFLCFKEIPKHQLDLPPIWSGSKS